MIISPHIEDVTFHLIQRSLEYIKLISLPTVKTMMYVVEKAPWYYEHMKETADQHPAVLEKLVERNPKIITQIGASMGMHNIPISVVVKAISHPLAKISADEISKFERRDEIVNALLDAGYDDISTYGKFTVGTLSIETQRRLVAKVEEIQLLAIEKNPSSIQYIKNPDPTDRVKRAAVKADISCLRYIKDVEIIAEELRKDPTCFKFVRHQTKELVEMAVKLDVKNLEYVHGALSNELRDELRKIHVYPEVEKIMKEGGGTSTNVLLVVKKPVGKKPESVVLDETIVINGKTYKLVSEL